MLRYAITDRSLYVGRRSAAAVVSGEGGLVRRCHDLALNGIDFILVREKDLAAGELTTLCRAVHQVVREANHTAGSTTRVLVSGRPDVAVAAGLEGVHLGSQAGELSAGQIRKVFDHAELPEPWVSVSCHSLNEVRRARESGASAVLFAPVFGKVVDGQQVAAGSGLDLLRDACALAGPLPVFALGGVTHDNTAACLSAGAAGVAGIRLFFAAAPHP